MMGNTMVPYEAQTLLGLDMFQCRTRFVSDTDTYSYTELCNFPKLLAVSAYVSCLIFMSGSVHHKW